MMFFVSKADRKAGDFDLLVIGRESGYYCFGQKNDLDNSAKYSWEFQYLLALTA